MPAMESSDPVGRALWFIESHYAGGLTLDEVAAVSGVSRFHLSRAFADSLGLPVMRYVRARRLSEAARRLAAGAPDILAVALDAGYGSHEAFTRAFREEFGLTPEVLRAQGDASHLTLTEANRMDTKPNAAIRPPCIVESGPLLVAGLSRRYACDDKAGIPEQWQQFGAHVGHVPGQVGSDAYGVCYNTDDEGSIDYLSGVEVGDFARLPSGFASLRMAAQRYAVFRHEGHVSEIASTWGAIWSRGLPQSGHAAADAPCFERYGPEFGGRTGEGGFEIWVPVKPR